MRNGSNEWRKETERGQSRESDRDEEKHKGEYKDADRQIGHHGL